nr:uncharacterized protein LOC129153102 isoform X1 [Nothobranchius furzeri]
MERGSTIGSLTGLGVPNVLASPAAEDDRWFQQGANPKAPTSSTPVVSGVWSTVAPSCGGGAWGACHRSPPSRLPLTNRFRALDPDSSRQLPDPTAPQDHRWSPLSPFLSLADTETLMHAFITGRFDYCNALLSGLPKKSTPGLQLLQNSAARVLVKTRRQEHITLVLNKLHWLPVCFRVDFKVLLMVFKCLNGLGPSYLSELLHKYEPSRSLRSSSSHVLVIPKARTHSQGEASFQLYGPRLWNGLPEDLRTVESVLVFKARLKTHLFSIAFN